MLKADARMHYVLGVLGMPTAVGDPAGIRKEGSNQTIFCLGVGEIQPTLLPGKEKAAAGMCHLSGQGSLVQDCMECDIQMQ